MAQRTLRKSLYEIKVVGFVDFKNQIPSHLNLLPDFKSNSEIFCHVGEARHMLD